LMATTFANNGRHSPAGSRIDVPLAAVAGLAVGFVVFVMPGDLLSRAVEASGLPQLLSAAQPPLGTKARALIAIAGLLAAFGTVFLLLRLLGRKGRPAPRRRQEPETETEIEPAVPRLRRADVHPDAPSRRPILAARELGEPARREPATAPFWHPDDFPAEPDEASAESEDTAEPVETLDLGGSEIEILQPEAFVTPEDPAPPVEELAPPPSVDESTLPDLMSRLERGLARRLRQQGVFPAREATAVAEPARAPEPEPQPEPEPIRSVAPDFRDDRLSSAIENLQKMAARAR
jgi:hypothetical protein